MKKKYLLLIFILSVGLLSSFFFRLPTVSAAPVFAGDWENYAVDLNGNPITSLSGNGSEDYPYEITSAGELAFVAKSNKNGNWYIDTFFEIVSPIDLSGHYFGMIGSDTSPFFGTLTFGDNGSVTNINQKYVSDGVEIVNLVPIARTEADLIYFSVYDGVNVKTHDWQHYSQGGNYIDKINIEGNGSQANPFKIKNIYQLSYAAHLVSLGTVTGGELFQIAEGFTFNNAYYELADNINLSGRLWIPFGTKENPFKGFFNGKSYNISNAMIYAIPDNEIGQCGFFGSTQGAEIKNFSLTDVQVRISKDSTKNLNSSFSAGLLIGYAQGTSVKEVSVSGSIDAQTGASIGAGGIAGSGLGTDISDSIVSLNLKIKQTSQAPITYAGGFVGNLQNGSLRNNYLTGALALSKPNTDSTIYAGGIVGYLGGTISSLHNNLSLADITLEGRTTNTNIGGIIGRVNPNLSQAPKGNQITYSYYLKNNSVSTVVSSPIANAEATAYPYGLKQIEEKPANASFFENGSGSKRWNEDYLWDFASVWKFDDSTNLPSLQIFNTYTIMLHTGSDIFELYFEIAGTPVMQVDNPESFASSMEFGVGDPVKIIARFKNYVGNEDAGYPNDMTYGSFYNFTTWLQNGEAKDITSVSPDGSISLEFSCSSVSSGLYAVNIQAKKVNVILNVSGTGSYQYQNEVYSTKRIFESSYGSHILFRSVRTEPSYLFSAWKFMPVSDYYAPEDLSPEVYDFWQDQTEASSLQFQIGSINSPTVLVGTGTENEGGNGLEKGTLSIYLTAVFTNRFRDITYEVDGNGSFTVNSDGESTEINENVINSNNNVIRQAEGKTIKLIAVANEGFEFAGWFSGDVQISGDVEFNLTIDATTNKITAKFKAVEQQESFSSTNLLIILIPSIGGGLIVIGGIIFFAIKKRKNSSYKRSH